MTERDYIQATRADTPHGRCPSCGRPLWALIEYDENDLCCMWCGREVIHVDRLGDKEAKFERIHIGDQAVAKFRDDLAKQRAEQDRTGATYENVKGIIDRHLSESDGNFVTRLWHRFWNWAFEAFLPHE